MKGGSLFGNNTKKINERNIAFREDMEKRLEIILNNVREIVYQIGREIELSESHLPHELASESASYRLYPAKMQTLLDNYCNEFLPYLYDVYNQYYIKDKYPQHPFCKYILLIATSILPTLLKNFPLFVIEDSLTSDKNHFLTLISSNSSNINPDIFKLTFDNFRYFSDESIKLRILTNELGIDWSSE